MNHIKEDYVSTGCKPLEQGASANDLAAMQTRLIQMPHLALVLYDATSDAPPQRLPEMYEDTPENREFLRGVILRYCDWAEQFSGLTHVLAVMVMSEVSIE